MRYEVKELRYAEQDMHLLGLAIEHANDTDLVAEIDPDVLIDNCITLRADLDRRDMNVFLAYREGRAVGYAVALASKSLYSARTTATLELLFVTRTLRGSRVAPMLIRSFEQWSTSIGARRLFTGTVNRRYAEKTSHMYEKLGYALVGALHVKEID